MKIHAYTSFSFSYLNRARVLAKTLRRHHPDWVIWAVITDQHPPGFEFDLSIEKFDRVITAEMLFGEDTNSWLFKHDIVEACTAVKGRALQHIMADPTAAKVVYFDPDIAVFNQMTEVIDLLDNYSIVLTPHQLDPEPATHHQAIRDNEITSLDYGVFNLGFIAVNQTHEAHRFAQWWADRLFDLCHDRLDIGIFVDQKWCNLVPCFFDGVKVLRDPGYNVASWNLSQRTMLYDEAGQAQINGRPLRFYHFTKLGSIGDTMTRRYAQNNTEIYELWWWYRQEVLSATDPLIPEGWWYYGTFDNGVKIIKSMRVLYRDRRDLQMAFKDPFETGLETYFNWLKLQ
jgi:hypothetical protein